MVSRKDGETHAANPKYTLYCGNGKVELSFLKQPPQLLSFLLFKNATTDGKYFQFHMIFAFTSPGAKLDNNFNNRGMILNIGGDIIH